MQILIRTPLWVWPLLALVVALGAVQMRERTYSRARVLALPFVMVALSLGGIVGAFGPRVDAVGSWAFAVLVALGANQTLLRWPRGVEHTGDSGGAYRVPGSVVPLLLILVIFALRFVTGAIGAIAPERAAEPTFAIAVCGVLGIASGLFLARTWRILATPPRQA